MKDSVFSREYTLNCGGDLVDLSTPKVMGILNTTPDSFYDGGQHKGLDLIMQQAEKMVREGATFIDVGGYSSRPGAQEVSVQEEIERTASVIEKIANSLDVYVSIDTFRADVAQEALKNGAHLINDISGGKLDEKMIPFVVEKNLPYICMHMRGNPQTMQTMAHYEHIASDVTKELSGITNYLKSQGVSDVVLDPGFGFAKSLEQNYELLDQMEVLHTLECPILVGVSRKSMIYKLLGKTPQEALNGTTALNTVALLKGASILRVHDVAPAMEVVQLVNQLNAKN